MPLIAGHVFSVDVRGKRVCGCGKLWVDIARATQADIGVDGFAHVGSLLEAEYISIERERDRIWSLITDVALSAGHVRKAMLDDAENQVDEVNEVDAA